MIQWTPEEMFHSRAHVMVVFYEYRTGPLSRHGRSGEVFMKTLNADDQIKQYAQGKTGDELRGKAFLVETGLTHFQYSRSAWIAGCFCMRPGIKASFDNDALRESLRSVKQWIDNTGYPLRIAFAAGDGCYSLDEWRNTVLPVIEEVFANTQVMICRM